MLVASAIVAGDERAVAVAVVRVGVVRDEVIAFDELVAAEVRRAAEAPAVGVGDAGVEHRDDHAAPAGGAVGGDVRPRFGRVHAEFADEVPLQLLPVARRPADAGSLGMNVAGGRGRT